MMVGEFECGADGESINVNREDSRLTTSMLLGANAFLLSNGSDVASRARELHDCVRPLMLRVRRVQGSEDQS